MHSVFQYSLWNGAQFLVSQFIITFHLLKNIHFTDQTIKCNDASCTGFLAAADLNRSPHAVHQQESNPLP